MMFQIRWLWRNIESKYRWRFIAGLILSAITSGMLLINPFLTSMLIDEVIVGQRVDPLIPLLMSMLGVQVLRLVLRYMMIVCLETSSHLPVQGAAVPGNAVL